MKKFFDVLYYAWTIGLKDVRDAFLNRATLVNILVLVGLVFFFYFMSTLRPFDRRVNVVVLDEGSSSLPLTRTTLRDGAEINFRTADSRADLEQRMAYQDLGIILPKDIDRQVASGNEVTLGGYVHWAKRGQVGELENRYSALFSELFGIPVMVVIGDNILVPKSNALGMASTAAFHIFFAVFWMALTVVPFLIIEERQAKTMDALLVSPASPGTVVFGKAIAGFILVTAIAGFSVALNGIYIIHWGWALVGFILTSLLAIGIALLLGTLIRSPKQITLWILPVALLFVVPGFFTDEPNLTPAAKAVMNWLPSVAINRILGLSVSDGAAGSLVGLNLVIAVVAIVIVYTLVIWQIRRSDR